MKRGETFLSEEIKELHWRPFQHYSWLFVWGLSGRISHTLPLCSKLSLLWGHKSLPCRGPREKPPLPESHGQQPSPTTASGKWPNPIFSPVQKDLKSFHCLHCRDPVRSVIPFRPINVSHLGECPQIHSSQWAWNAFVSIKVSSQQKFSPKAPEAKKLSFDFSLHFIDIF